MNKKTLLIVRVALIVVVILAIIFVPKLLKKTEEAPPVITETPKLEKIEEDYEKYSDENVESAVVANDYIADGFTLSESYITNLSTQNGVSYITEEKVIRGASIKDSFERFMLTMQFDTTGEEKKMMDSAISISVVKEDEAAAIQAVLDILAEYTSSDIIAKINNSLNSLSSENGMESDNKYDTNVGEIRIQCSKTYSTESAAVEQFDQAGYDADVAEIDALDVDDAKKAEYKEESKLNFITYTVEDTDCVSIIIGVGYLDIPYARVDDMLYLDPDSAAALGACGVFNTVGLSLNSTFVVEPILNAINVVESTVTYVNKVQSDDGVAITIVGDMTYETGESVEYTATANWDGTYGFQTKTTYFDTPEAVLQNIIDISTKRFGLAVPSTYVVEDELALAAAETGNLNRNTRYNTFFETDSSLVELNIYFVDNFGYYGEYSIGANGVLEAARHTPAESTETPTENIGDPE